MCYNQGIFSNASMPENPNKKSKDGHLNSHESKRCVQKKAEIERSWLKERLSRVLKEVREYFDSQKYGRLRDFVVQKYQLPKNSLKTRQEAVFFMTRLRQMKFNLLEAAKGWPAASLNLEFISRNTLVLMFFLIEKKSEVMKLLKTPAGKGIDEKKVMSIFSDILANLRTISRGQFWRTVKYDYFDPSVFDEHDLIRSLPYKYGASRYMAQFLNKEEGAEKIWAAYHRAGMFNDFFLQFMNKKVPIHITKKYIVAIKPRDFLIYYYSYLSGEMADQLLTIAEIKQKNHRDDLIKKLAGKYSPKTKSVTSASAEHQGSKTNSESAKEKPRRIIRNAFHLKYYERYLPFFADQKSYERFVIYMRAIEGLYGENRAKKLPSTLKGFNDTFKKNKIGLVELLVIFKCWNNDFSSQELGSYLSISARFGIKKINFALGEKDFWDNIGDFRIVKQFLRRFKDKAYRLWLERNKNRIRGLSLWQLTNVNHYNPSARLKPEQQEELLSLLRMYPNFRKFNLFDLYLKNGDKRLFSLIPFLSNEQDFAQAGKILDKGLSPKEIIAGMKAFSFAEMMYVAETRFKIFDFLILYNGLKVKYPYLRSVNSSLKGIESLHYCLVFGLSSKIIMEYNNRDLRFLSDINVDGIMRILKRKDLLPQKIKNFCETYNLNFFQRYHPQLLHNMLDRDFDLPDRRDKPIILVFTAKADHNGAFYRRGYRKLHEQANLIFFDMNSINDPQKFGVEWAKENLRGRKIAHVFYQGHGSREDILLSEKGWVSVTRQNAYKLSCLLPFLAKKAQILLYSCSTAATGKTGRIEERLASISRTIARRAYPGHYIFAAREVPDNTEIGINKEGGLSVRFKYKSTDRWVKAVEWRCEGRVCRRIE